MGNSSQREDLVERPLSMVESVKAEIDNRDTRQPPDDFDRDAQRLSEDTKDDDAITSLDDGVSRWLNRKAETEEKPASIPDAPPIDEGIYTDGDLQAATWYEVERGNYDRDVNQFNQYLNQLNSIADENQRSKAEYALSQVRRELEQRRQQLEQVYGQITQSAQSRRMSRAQAAIAREKAELASKIPNFNAEQATRYLSERGYSNAEIESIGSRARYVELVEKARRWDEGHRPSSNARRVMPGKPRDNSVASRFTPPIERDNAKTAFLRMKENPTPANIERHLHFKMERQNNPKPKRQRQVRVIRPGR